MYPPTDADTRSDREAWSRVVLAAMRYVLVMGEDVALTDPLTRFILWSTEPEVILEVMGEALRIIGQHDSDDLLRVVPEGREVQARFLPPEGKSNGSGGVVLSPITVRPDGECGCDDCESYRRGDPVPLSDGDEYSTYVINAPDSDSIWDRIASELGTCPCQDCQVLDPDDSSN